MALIYLVQESAPHTYSPHSEYTIRSQNDLGAQSSCGLFCLSV